MPLLHQGRTGLCSLPAPMPPTRPRCRRPHPRTRRCDSIGSVEPQLGRVRRATAGKTVAAVADRYNAAGRIGAQAEPANFKIIHPWRGLRASRTTAMRWHPSNGKFSCRISSQTNLQCAFRASYWQYGLLLYFGSLQIRMA
jgi:hypothetical protein